MFYKLGLTLYKSLCFLGVLRQRERGKGRRGETEMQVRFEYSQGEEGTIRKVKNLLSRYSTVGDRQEWKVLIMSVRNTEHFPPVRMTKAIEKEIGKIRFAK